MVGTENGGKGMDVEKMYSAGQEDAETVIATEVPPVEPIEAEPKPEVETPEEVIEQPKVEEPAVAIPVESVVSKFFQSKPKPDGSRQVPPEDRIAFQKMRQRAQAAEERAASMEARIAALESGRQKTTPTAEDIFAGKQDDDLMSVGEIKTAIPTLIDSRLNDALARTKAEQAESERLRHIEELEQLEVKAVADEEAFKAKTPDYDTVTTGAESFISDVDRIKMLRSVSPAQALYNACLTHKNKARAILGLEPLKPLSVAKPISPKPQQQEEEADDEPLSQVDVFNAVFGKKKPPR